MNLKQRVAQLQKIERQLPGELERIARQATQRAVEEAAERTPPTAGDLRGTNTRTGNLKQSWATASETSPRKQGKDYVTVLANDMQYASYVDEGHRVDRHFVPGLIINPYSGLLEYNPDGTGGIIVGTKTAYVKGLFLVDKAQKKYAEIAKKELEALMEDIE